MKKNINLSTENQLDTIRVKQIVENRKNISPIIEAIILCGRQDFSLRGHRDSGKFSVKNNNINDGNFQS